MLYFIYIGLEINFLLNWGQFAPYHHKIEIDLWETLLNILTPTLHIHNEIRHSNV